MFSKLLQTSRLVCRLSQTIKPMKALASSSVKFSSNTSLAQVDKIKSKLQKALQKELKYEEENYQKDDTVEVLIFIIKEIH